MKIELKNVHYMAALSEETACFEASVYIDGVKAGSVSNRGHGGSNEYHPNALWQKLEAYAKVLPEVETDLADPHDKSTPFKYQPDADHVIGKLLTAFLVEKDVKRLLKSKTAFTKKGQKGLFTVKGIFTRAQVTKAFPNFEHYLNDMLIADAVQVYLTCQ